MATMEEALVPLYLYHRYAVESAASAIGGQDYIYAFRGDGRVPTKWVPAAQQRAALDALIATLEAVRADAAEDRARQDPATARRTGARTAKCSPATPARHSIRSAPRRRPRRCTIGFILSPDRAARMVAQHARRPDTAGSAPSVIEALRTGARSVLAVANAYEEEIRRATARVLVERLMALAGGAPMPQVRATARAALASLQGGTFAVTGGPSARQDRAARCCGRRHQALPRPAHRPNSRCPTRPTLLPARRSATRAWICSRPSAGARGKTGLRP